jgi:hypothetical protein
MRRAAVGAAAAILLAIATGSSAFAAAGKKNAQPHPATRSPPTPECTVHFRGTQQIVRFRTGIVFGKKRLDYTHVTATPLGVRGDASARTTLTLGDRMLADVEARSFEAPAGATTQVLLRFGNAFSGVREMLLTSTDGKVLRGDVDRRAIDPFRIGADPSGLGFQDGKPAPSLRVDPELQQAMRTLLAAATRDLAHCRKLTGGTSPAAPSSDAPDPPDTGRSDSTSASSDCLSCTGACVAAGTGAAAACCVASFGIGCALCVAGAAVGELACIKYACHGVGQPCCPVSCGEVACCSRNDTCLDPSRGVCCGPDTNACNRRECCGTSDRCLPDGRCCAAGLAVCREGRECCQPGEDCSTEGICCAQARPGVVPVSCRGQCCAADDVCRDGVTCCPPDDPVCRGGVCCRGGRCDQGGDCCFPPNYLCRGLCCSPLDTCCGDTCCSNISAQCMQGTCCPNERVCGGICCPENEFCRDPRTQRCDTCGPELVACQSQNAGAPPNYLCCPPHVACCDGVCCPAGQICCTVGNKLGCYQSSLCIK